MGLLGRSLEIVRGRGLRAYTQAIRRFLLWHPVADEIRWRANRLVRAQPRVVKDIQGRRMLLDISRKGIHKYLFLYGCHEPESSRVFRRMLPKDARVVDIGANIGYYVLMEAQVARKVYAIEPELQNLELLRENIELNSFGDRVEVYQLALSDTVGKASLSISDFPNQHRLQAPCDPPLARYVEVATTTLDEFLKDKEVDVIRMDLEGAEWLVLKGMTAALTGDKALALFIEVHPVLMKDYGGDAATLLKLLLDSGFKIRHLVVDRPAASFPIRRSIKAWALPEEQAIEFNNSPGNTLSDKDLSRILDASMTFRLFMERPASKESAPAV